MMIPTPRNIRDAAANATHLIRYGRLADLRSMPVEPIDEGFQHPVFRYRPSKTVIPTGPPVLLVPPPTASASSAFDLRRGCSLAEHLVSTGRRVYLLDYEQTFTDRDLGLDHWIGEVLPKTIRKVSADAGGQPVQLVGWCVGGILSLLTTAADQELPIASITAIAAPVDFSGLRQTGAPQSPPGLTGTEAGLPALLGGIAQSLAGHGYRLLGIDKYLVRPFVVLTNLDNADFLAHTEAVDIFTGRLPAYSSRTVGQMRRLFFRKNDLAKGAVAVSGKRVLLADVKVPVLVIAGRADEITPWQAVHLLTRLLTGSSEVRFETAPGDHLGVLTGRTARATTWGSLDRWLDAGSVKHGLRAPKRDRKVTASRP